MRMNGPPFGPVLRAAVALGLALATTPAHAQEVGWRDRHIDGSSRASFEASISALQNELPANPE